MTEKHFDPAASIPRQLGSFLVARDVVTYSLRLQYEQAVSALRLTVIAMRRDDTPSEVIARTVHAERRRLAGVFKELTPEPLRSRIYHRTIAVYGDPLGPTVEFLRARGKDWDDIIDSATRPGAAIVDTPSPRYDTR